MASTISVYQCFTNIYHILFYFGVSCFRLKNDALCSSFRTKLYSYCVRFGLISGFVGGMVMKVRNAESITVGHLSPVLRMIGALEIIFSLSTYLQVVATMGNNKHKHIRLAGHFRQLDNRMSHDFPGLCWNYDKLKRKYGPLSMSVFVFYFIVGQVYLFNLSNCWCDIHNTVLIAVTYSCLTCAPGTASFLHMAQMDLLRIRYRLLHKMLQQQYQQHRSAQRQTAENVVIHLMGYYKNYTKLIPRINEVFGHAMATIAFYDFYILTCMTFLLCQKASTTAHFREYIFIILFMTPRIYKVVMGSVYGYLIKKEQRNCFHTISLCEDHFKNSARLKTTLHGLLHWAMHNNYEISLGKNIRFNLNIAFMILHGIVNYVIILIQLQFQQNNIANNIKASNGPLHKDVEILRRNPY